ncbi:MAG: response regulator [Lachnospiraceae bacterium]|nr:response regulator [Lachnospiraceae bacterium]
MNKHILIVDDNKANLTMAREALIGEYDINLVISGAQALQFLSKKATDLILLDINMPDMNGIETMQKIKENFLWSKIPVIFLTADTSIDTEMECLDLGAVDFIAKPFVPKIMLSRIARTLELEDYRTDLEKAVEKKTQQIRDIQQRVISGFANIIESRDDLTGQHVKRTSAYVKAIAEELVARNMYSEILGSHYLENMCKAAPMHDIGKIRISDTVLCKPGKLTDEEFTIMKTHTTEGERILQTTMKGIERESYLNMARDMALYHHEKWNGTGYPTGKTGEDIPLCARVMAVADVFDALISKRCYKESMSFDQAFAIIEDSMGTHFDPDIAKVFLSIRPRIEEISKSDFSE